MFGKKRKIRELIQSNVSMYTPDLPLLEQYQSALLFVADDWLRSGPERFILSELGAMHQCTAYTMNNYKFLIKTGNYRQPEHKGLLLQTKKDGYKVEGEILSLPDPVQAFLKLDKLRLNGVEFERKRIHLLYAYRRQETQVYEGFHKDTEPHFLTSDYGGRVWNGATVTDRERVYVLTAWTYIAKQDWLGKIIRNPEQYSEVSRYPSDVERRWLSEFYRYSPKDYR